MNLIYRLLDLVFQLELSFAMYMYMLMAKSFATKDGRAGEAYFNQARMCKTLLDMIGNLPEPMKLRYRLLCLIQVTFFLLLIAYWT